MLKKYQLLIDSPTQPKGMIATQEPGGTYQAHNPSAPADENFYFPAYIIENRPTVWQEIVEEPEKKIVERWRAKKWESYNTLYCVDREDQHQVDSQHYDQGEYFASTQVSNRAQKRVKIMCRLMGLAETIEEGSTEMEGAWTIGFDTAKDMDLMPIYTNNTVLNTSKLATFNTKENTQLFLDSAGQDAIDWYGAVK